MVTACRENADGFFFHQSLQVRQGEHDPITVMEIPEVGPEPPTGLCRFTSLKRFGLHSMAFGAFQRLAVTADGSAVAFELSDDFSIFGHFLAPEQKGLFYARADGTGLHRVGDQSHQAGFLGPFTYPADLTFSPDGRTLAFPDLGPGPDGEEDSQIVTLDLATGRRTQLTELPAAAPAPDAPPLVGGACCPGFFDNQTIAFNTEANPTTDAHPEGLNPDGESIVAVVNADGSGLRRIPLAVTLPSSQVDLQFLITSSRPRAISLAVPGQPLNAALAGFPLPTSEAFFFAVDQNLLLQLTNFHRFDTGVFGADARRRVYFVASADPLGTNPSENCQIFSIAALGGDLRQLTQFHEAEHSQNPCGYYGFPRPLGCTISRIRKDVDSGALLFYSTCDPFGTNPNGGQLFVLGADGTGLRQLTNTRGLVTEADGTVIGEFPDPVGYSGLIK